MWMDTVQTITADCPRVTHLATLKGPLYSRGKLLSSPQDIVSPVLLLLIIYHNELLLLLLLNIWNPLPAPVSLSLSLLIHSLFQQWKRTLWHRLQGRQRQQVRFFPSWEQPPSLRMGFTAASRTQWPFHQLARENCRVEGKRRETFSSQSACTAWFHKLSWLDVSPK